MRRIRQISGGVSQAASARLSVAVVLSASLHLYLIYGLALRPTHVPADRPGIIAARLLHEPAMTTRPGVAVRAMKHRRNPGLKTRVPSSPDPVEAPVPADQILPAGDRGVEPEVSSASLPDPIHYAARDLDIYPRPLSRIEPAYPESALAGDIGGSVTLMLLIDESGRVTDVSMVDASPQGVFEESAIRALAATAYFPAQKDGRAVRSRILVNVDYDPIAAALPR